MKTLKLFSKKQTSKADVMVADPDLAAIEMIHKEFESAGEKLLQQANEIINASKVLNEAKIKRLETIGFENSQEVSNAKETLRKQRISEQLAKTIEYYKIHYPLNKFITKEQIEEICKKYELIYGSTDKYTGFVPEKNLKEIEQFNLKVEDIPWSSQFDPIRMDDPYMSKETISFLTDSLVEDGKAEKEIYDYLIKEGYADNSGLLIAAPQKDFNISQREEIKNFQIVAKIVPDPVVFAPVREGFLIVTAWGKESEDPIIKNEITN